MVVDSGTGRADELLVLLSKFIEELANLNLTHCRWKVVFAFEADTLRQLTIESVERIRPNLSQHFCNILRGMRKILVHNVESGFSFVFRRTPHKPLRP